ncbi:UDP-N-acetyl-D-glucosamine 6-dehydrogenase [Candidatus Kuenenia stuttgartiensis]|uniref:Similar to UDP-glucose/GDP-mannose dehydrogenase n=1 Tax=Kuenenia stuttgartiensis TaxID=174633 RepID=Q1Q1R0_KUEST|nr:MULTISPECIES: nucleotide sugar dehydrogenase [Kuenenia]MCZ7621554.1 nucleotide sugar dehydrogenase [Candidatus Kuenenia sp.]QII10978.1 UDP-N-acetyl-D-glucosamine 6-dehydrogenase [Candidatus Kuenenia stuttgartiensis]CAJ73955.1 similar to UDP-glucose/GDP-mannose dehydrogenase [Candidatus Kuenenia stuttgartiensis]
MELIEKIKSKKSHIGIIGLGYVGLPLVIEFCKAGFQVTGFDIDPEKVTLLHQGKSYIKHISSSLLTPHFSQFTPTTDFSQLLAMDCIIICVPTPLNKYREPDMSYVFNTTKTIAGNLRKGQLIVLESTTYPGTTDEDMRPMLEESGLKTGEDFYLAFSPEREDPNNKDFSTRTIPKVVGGYTKNCLTVAQALYDSVVVKTVPVSSTRVAEATKLLENIYRSVNIALVNELKMLFDRMGIDVWEVIEAAKTKPFGFQAFYPGPGLGGHCIPIDPFYLTWKAREYEFSTRFIELAGEINTNMPYYVVQKTVEALNENGKSIKGAKILILGLSYKKDIDDTRESPSLKIMDLLGEKDAHVDYNDPYIPVIPKTRKYSFNNCSVPLHAETLAKYDAVVIATEHADYDPDFILKNSQLIVDTRNLIKNHTNHSDKVKRA